MLDAQVKKLFTKHHVQGQLKFKSRTTVKEESDVKEIVEENALSSLKSMSAKKKEEESKLHRIVFESDVTHNFASLGLLGAFSVQYHIPKHGTCITERWDTSNTLSSTLVWKGIAPNLMLKFNNVFAPDSKESSSQMKVEYGNENYKVSASVCPTVNELEMAGVGFLREWYMGAQVKTNLLTEGDVNTVFCLGRRNKLYNFHFSVENANSFGGSVFVKMHQNLQLGVRIGWQNQNSNFAVATKYNVHDRLALLAKVDNESKLDISAVHKISPDVKLILSAQLQGSQNGVNSNSFGAGLTYKPQ